jgi:hypothetical protein
MATTTNYSWTTPDDTALVKDGAAAIRSLGTAIDTTTKALNPSTTLGDIEYRSSTANTNTRLGLGTAGQVLTVNSGATAPEWASIISGGMTLLSTTALSGTATTITGISQSYTNLFIYIPTLTFNVSADLAFKTGDTSLSASYYYIRNQDAITTLQAAVGSISAGQSAVTWQGTTFFIHRYSDATARKTGYAVSLDASGGHMSDWSWADYNTTTGISRFSVTSVAGTSTFSSGSVYIYGVK